MILLICLLAGLITPSVAHASAVGAILAEVFGWGKPGFPILVMVGISFGAYILRETMAALGSDSRMVDTLKKVIVVNLVFGTVWVIVDGIFGRLLGG